MINKDEKHIGTEKVEFKEESEITDRKELHRLLDSMLDYGCYNLKYRDYTVEIGVIINEVIKRREE
jgi:hypothetical protein